MNKNRNVASKFDRSRRSSFPIVGIGASAGGLETFSELLKNMPPDTGMAFVLIQHLDPEHTSLLAGALAKITPIPVHEIRNGMKIQPNHAYVIPPAFDLDIARGALRLIPRKRSPGKPHLPIDSFFSALAANFGSNAVGVVLSGTASDGTEGLRAIKDEGGFTFVQDPSVAKFRGMPESALNAGVVDFSLSIPELAAELARIGHNQYYSGGKAELFSASEDEKPFGKILQFIQGALGIDFNEYKPATTKRRLARRLALLRIESLEAYLKYLRGTPGEAQALCDDILIHVTSFFRDPEAFERLKKDVFPKVLKHKKPNVPIRMWVAGCSTGEEVYSLVMTLLEFLGEMPAQRIQVFGSDISENMIEKSRLGTYLDSQMRDMSSERLKRFFVRVDGGYRIAKHIRDLCVFVRHDLARDPPFSRLDLITCRNVLIYFDQALQKRILSTFHYCLNQPGFLLLGKTESVTSHHQFFAAEDKVNRVFSRTATLSQLRFPGLKETRDPGPRSMQARVIEPIPGRDISKIVDDIVLADYSPCGVLVNERLETILFRGRTSLYLEQPSGQPETNLLKMVREGLFIELKMALAKAKKDSVTVRKNGVAVKHRGVSRYCNIIVRPISRQLPTKERFFLVLFEETKISVSGKPMVIPKGKRPGKDIELESRRSASLKEELDATKSYLQSLNQENLKANDALASANEELVSGNEELQSMNEELETAKEELQSTNEELTTVNDELQNRNHETGLINNDLVNLLESVEIPIVILDKNRCVRRFTPQARTIMNLLPGDVGRSIDDIKLNVTVNDLNQQIADVIGGAGVKISEVQDQNGKWHQIQIRPYRTPEKKIDGVILSLVDIDTLRQAKAEAEEASRTKDLFLATLSHELRTPLTSLILQAQLLKRGKLDQAKIKKASEQIENAVRVQSQLIEDLLDISRIITGKLKMVYEEIDLVEVVKAAINTVKDFADSKAMRVEFVSTGLSDSISGDSIRLQQVIWNLLNNAIKFSNRGGKVLISLEEVRGCAQIQVIDKGQGIEASFLPQIFTRFSQAEATITRSHGGLGLGLAIVRHIVEMHGGSVSAESMGKDQGAIFTVTLPLVKTEPHGDDHRENDHTGPTRRRLLNAKRPSKLAGRRILVVDDDPGTRDALGDLLGQIGAEVRTAESAAEGMRVLKEFNPEELVCDISMPGEDGYSFLRRVRELGSMYSDVPAIALTALAGEKDRQQAFSAGFQMHLAKPVDIDGLEDALVQLNENHMLH